MTSQRTRRLHSLWFWLIGLAIVMGVGFRLTNIGQKIYWHDEAYSTFRAAGYLSQDIYGQVFEGQPITPSGLQVFQQLNPNSTYTDTLKSLALEDPQHAPLYFLMARAWMRVFGSEIATSRLLPVLISLGSLPLMYLLAMEVFATSLLAWFTTALLALSPIDILFAQTVRQYSLLTFSIVLSNWLLLRADRRHHYRPWLFYALAVAMGLYSHIFFVLNWIAQGLFALGSGKQTGWRFFLASGLALMLFSPWIFVLYHHRDAALASNAWSGVKYDNLIYLQTWLHTFAGVLVDMPVPQLEFWTLILWLLVLSLIGYAFVILLKTASLRQRIFVCTAAWIPFLLLVAADLSLGGSRTTVPRYLLGALPGIQLALGLALAHLHWHHNRLAQTLWGLILVASFTSCLVSAQSETWWHKNVSYDNDVVAAYLNANASAWVVTDRGNYTNIGNLLALSYHLRPEVTFLPFPNPVEPVSLNRAMPDDQISLLSYRISPDLQQILQQQSYQLHETPVPGLFRVIPPTVDQQTLP